MNEKRKEEILAGTDGIVKAFENAVMRCESAEELEVIDDCIMSIMEDFFIARYNHFLNSALKNLEQHTQKKHDIVCHIMM